MQPALFAWSSPRSHPPKAVWTLQLRLHEEQKWEFTCRWTEYSVLWTSDAGFTSAAFRKWLWVYRFNVGDVCRRSVQINLFGGCHFIEIESHKPPEETNPVLGCLFANVIFDSYCWHPWPVILRQGVSLLATLNKQKCFPIVKYSHNSDSGLINYLR